jgi:hypothetical protein
MIEALTVQADTCESLGSNMYAQILRGIKDDYQSRGSTYALLHDASERPIHDATPLRLLGALHRIVLNGSDISLARHYESVGGTSGPTLLDDVLRAIELHTDEIVAALCQQVQTNEPGRSLCHLALSHWLAHLGISHFHLLEVGASAGLTMSFDRYCIETPHGIVGDPTSPLHFPASWIETSFPFHPHPAKCTQRRGVDISPIDVSTDNGVHTLLSFVWPDQQDRLSRLRTAIAITQKEPHRIDSGSVDAWLPPHLDERTDGPVLVFHSIVWQYLGVQVQRNMHDILFTHGETRSRHAPLIWARMEPAGRVADIQVTIWDGSPSPQQWNVGTIGYHGQSIRWNPQRTN